MTTSDQRRCPSKQLVHITEAEYNAVFYTLYDVTVRGNIQCIMGCIKLDTEIQLAVYDNHLQLCACVNRMVTSTPETDHTKEVYVIDLHRPGIYVLSYALSCCT